MVYFRILNPWLSIPLLEETTASFPGYSVGECAGGEPIYHKAQCTGRAPLCGAWASQRGPIREYMRTQVVEDQRPNCPSGEGGSRRRSSKRIACPRLSKRPATSVVQHNSRGCRCGVAADTSFTTLKMPRGGIEPPLPHGNWILSPARLPIPPPRRQFILKPRQSLRACQRASGLFWHHLRDYGCGWFFRGRLPANCHGFAAERAAQW